MRKKPTHNTFTCLVLAAGRGENDPMAEEFEVSHKCLLPVAGKPMISRILECLKRTGLIGKIIVSIENENILLKNPDVGKILHKGTTSVIPSKDRASKSVLAAAKELEFPLLVTTADHALLSPQIVENFVTEATKQQCDMAVGLVHETTISKAYPDVKRTYLRFSDGGYSGSNLFALMNEESLKVISFWQHIEKERKKPWKLIRAFGIRPLLKWLTGRLSLELAFKEASTLLKANVKPVILTDPHASIDVDKPSDHDLVEKILANKDKN